MNTGNLSLMRNANCPQVKIITNHTKNTTCIQLGELDYTVLITIFVKHNAGIGFKSQKHI